MKVKSSHIDSIAYDTDKKVMDVTFAGGKQYHFHGIEEHLYGAFATAESHGKFFGTHIRGQYEHTTPEEK